MKTTEARKAIKAEYEKLTGSTYFVPMDYIALIHKVRIGELSAKQAAESIHLDQAISTGKEQVNPVMRHKPDFDFSTYRSAY